MTTSFLKKALSFIVLIVLLFAGDLFADASVKIAIFPFSISASGPNKQIQEKIPLMISEKLEQEGTKVFFPKTPPDFTDWKFPEFKKYGIESGVDFILTGSIFIAGEGISIDSRLINIYEMESSTSFF